MGAAVVVAIGPQVADGLALWADSEEVIQVRRGIGIRFRRRGGFGGGGSSDYMVEIWKRRIIRVAKQVLKCHAGIERCWNVISAAVDLLPCNLCDK
jgi:hypothetical protein